MEGVRDRTLGTVGRGPVDVVAEAHEDIILSCVGSYGSWGRDRLRDVLNALAAMQGVPLLDQAELQMLDEFSRSFNPTAGEVAFDGHEIKRYQDGSYHPWNPPDRGVRVKVYRTATDT